MISVTPTSAPTASMQVQAFAAEFNQLMHRVAGSSPLCATFAGKTINYIGGNEFEMRHPPPRLIEMPGLPSSDQDLFQKLEQTEQDLRNRSDVMLSRDEPYPYDERRGALDLYTEVSMVQHAVKDGARRVSELSRSRAQFLRNALMCVDPISDFVPKDISDTAALADDLYAADECIRSAAILMDSANPEHIAKAAEYLEKAAFYYFATEWLYAAAALSSQMAATANESLATLYPHCCTYMIRKASMSRVFAAGCWFNSLKNCDSKDDSSYDELKMFFGITNGLMYETGFSQEIVDNFLVIASLWHLGQGREADAMNDLMYLIYRQIQRPESSINPLRWRQIARTMREAAFAWCRSSKLKRFFMDAMRLAGAAQAMGGDVNIDFAEFMASICSSSTGPPSSPSLMG